MQAPPSNLEAVMTRCNLRLASVYSTAHVDTHTHYSTDALTHVHFNLFLARQVEHDLDGFGPGSIGGALKASNDLLSPTEAKAVRDHGLHIDPALLQHLDRHGVLHVDINP